MKAFRWFLATPPRFALLLFIVVLTLWVGWVVWGAKLLLGAVDPDAPRGVGSLGQLGDLFGGINALFAAFAFAGVAIAAYYQHQSWKLLEESAKREQDRHTLEAFQPLFFHLLSDLPPFPTSLQRFSGMVTGSLTSTTVAGVMLYNTDQLVDLLRRGITTSNAYAEARAGNKTQLVHVLADYAAFYSVNESVLGPYWRSLYRVLKLIDRSTLEREEKVLYVNIVRDRWSASELFLMTLHCATPYGSELRQLVEQYGLLKNMKKPSSLDAVSPDEELARWFFLPTALMSSQERIQALG